MELLANVLVGVATGLISSWLVTKFARFSSLRGEALRAIRRVEYVWEVKPKFSNHESVSSDLQVIASDLLYLGHRNAGDQLLAINQDFSSALQGAQAGTITYNDFDQRYGAFQSRIRHIAPTSKALFFGFRV